MTTEFNEETFKKEAGVDYSSWYQLNKRMKAGETLQGDDFKIYTTGLNAVIKLTGQKEITNKVLSLEDTVKSEREEIGQLQDLVLKKEGELTTLQDKTSEYEAKIKDYEEKPNIGPSSSQVKGLFEEVKDLRAQLDASKSELETYKTQANELEQKEEETRQREKYVKIKEEDIQKRHQDLVDKIELIEQSGNFSKFLVSTADSEKDMPKKVSYYKWALRIDTKNTDIWSKLGYAFIDSEQFDCALECAKNILELDKENAEAYKIKANVLLKTAKTESDLGEALKNFLKVVENGAGDAISYANISWLTYKLGNLKGAVDSYDKALGIDHNILDKVPVNTHVTLFNGFEELNPQKYEAIRKGPTAVSTEPAPRAVVRKYVVKKVAPRPTVQPPAGGIAPPTTSAVPPVTPPTQKPQDLEDLEDVLEDVDEEPAKKPESSAESKQAKKTDDDDALDCPLCGAIVGMNDKKCPECGAEFE